MAKKAARSTKVPSRDVRRTVLDSGVRVLTEKVRSAAAVAVGIWVDAGSRYEELRESGSTHMLQRIALHGTADRSEEDIARQLDALGGDVEYQTGRDFAAWLARVEPRDFARTLNLLADLTLRPNVTRDALAVEQKVLLSELRADEKDPDFNLERMFLRSLWKTNGLCRPPRGRLLAGKDKLRLEEFKPKSLERFHRETHHPRALTVVLSGDLNHDKARAAVEKTFDGLEMPKKTAGTLMPKPFRFIALRTRPEFSGVHMQLGMPACGAADRHRHEARLLTSILGVGADSRLARLIRSKSLRVEEGYSTLDMFADAGVFSVRLRASSRHAGEALDTAVAELRKLTTASVEQDELDRARARSRTATLAAIESLKSRAEDLAEKERYFGAIVNMGDELAQTDAVTPQQVRLLAAEWIAPHNLSLAALGNLKGVNIKPKTLRW